MAPKRVVPKKAAAPAAKSGAGAAKASAKGAAAKGAAKPKAGDGAAEAPEVPEVDDKLDPLLEELFVLYDEDQDGEIERVEMLNGEEKRLGGLEFGPKERKAAVAWFKEAGCEGSVTAGMFLSKEKWKTAMTKLVTEGAQADQRKPSDWVQEKYEKLFPKVTVVVGGDGGGGAGDDGAAALPPPPDYPLTIDFKELLSRIEEAHRYKRRPLVLTGGKTEVETFINYRNFNTIDAKMYVSRVYGLKNMSLEEAQQDARNMLTKAMNNHGFCKTLHIRMNNAALDFTGRFCCDDFPPDLFDGELWTIENAHKRGFFDDGHKMMLEMEDEKKWKEFDVVITSTFDLESAEEFLKDKIPHFEKLAILVIDPESFG